MTRLSARLAGALAVPLVLAGCGSVSSAASGLKEDAAAANAALAGAEGVGVVVRFDDADGDLVRALQQGPDGVPLAVAEIVAGSRLELRVTARDGRTLADQPPAGLPLAEQLRWTDTALSVSTERADLLSWRTVDGVLYASSDLAEVERVAAAAGSPVSLRDEVAGAPVPLPEVEDALRSGAAVSLPIADLLGSLGELTGGDDPLAEGVPEGLLDDLRAAVEPHARLTDLGSDDGVRRVTVEVDVKRLLQAVTGTLDEVMTELEGPDTLGLRDGTVTGTLTIDDGHYRRLDLPLAELAALRVSTDVELPDFGESRLVVELDDAVAPVAVPPRVADLDLLELLGSHDADVPALDDALVACLEQATTESAHAACLETA